MTTAMANDVLRPFLYCGSSFISHLIHKYPLTTDGRAGTMMSVPHQSITKPSLYNWLMLNTAKTNTMIMMTAPMTLKTDRQVRPHLIGKQQQQVLSARLTVFN